MKPRWHQAKFQNMGSLQKHGWMKPDKTPGVFLLFDGTLTVAVSLAELRAAIEKKSLVVDECLSLKAHLLIDQRQEEAFRASQPKLKLRKVEKGVKVPYDISLVDMSNGKNPDSIPMSKTA